MGKGYDKQTRKMIVNLRNNADKVIKQLQDSVKNLSLWYNTLADKLNPYFINKAYWRNKAYEKIIVDLLQWNASLQKDVNELKKKMGRLEGHEHEEIFY